MVDPLTTSECAELLGVSTKQVRRLIQGNRMQAYQMDTPTGKMKRSLVLPADLLKFAIKNKLPKQIIKAIQAKEKELSRG